LSRRSRISPATVFFALLALVLGVALYLKTRSREEVPPRVSVSPRPRVLSTPRPRVRTSPRPPVSPSPRPYLEAARPPLSVARIAILIDDLGNDAAAVDRIARWRHPFSAAVLPALSGSARAARQLEASGVEVLLHLPMEPRGFPSVRPGPGVLLRAQSDEELGSTLESDLDTVPGAVGVNNHMGSAATADPRVMRAIMRVLARRGLFFVDSRTTETTVAEAEARAAGVPAVSRRVFLDGVATGEAVEKSLAELASRARRDGFAVGIGHPHAATLTVLERELPRLEREGVRLVKVSELVN
jgi:polysaccharide deacetylase 2 family uncharacterized protein YibQ